MKNKNVIIALILFSKIDISNKSTRYFNKITNEKLKKDFFDDKKHVFFETIKTINVN